MRSEATPRKKSPRCNMAALPRETFANDCALWPPGRPQRWTPPSGTTGSQEPPHLRRVALSVLSSMSVGVVDAGTDIAVAGVVVGEDQLIAVLQHDFVAVADVL